MKTFQTQQTFVETSTVKTNVQNEIVESVPIRFNRTRNYMTTSFVSAQFPANQYGCYSLRIENHECRPQCQPPPQCAPQVVPMYVPMPYPCQQETQCDCEDEESYKEELLFLRQRLAELLKKEPEIQIKKERVEVVDNSKSEELELEVQKLRLQLNQAQNQYRSKEQEFLELRSGNDQSQQSLQQRIRNAEDSLYQIKLQIENLNRQINDKEDEIDQWEQRCHELESSVTVEIEEKTTKLTTELDVWKNRFKKLNSDYFACQEELIMVQAEIDSIKNGGVKEVKEVKVEKKVVGTTSTQQVVVGGGGQTSYQTTTQTSSSYQTGQPQIRVQQRGASIIQSQEIVKEGTPARLYPS